MNKISKLGLGTVQWGLSYGVSNQSGPTSPEMVSSILLDARRSGVSVLDTGSLYGNAEMVLGMNSLERFHVVTKTPQFATSRITTIETNQLKEAFQKSLDTLSCKKVYGLLVHHAEDILVPGGNEIVSTMMQLKEKGQVEKIGVSVYDSKQVDAVMEIFIPDLIQLPLSVLDQRMLSSGHLAMLKKEGVEIHVRSIFLQGLLLMPLDKIPAYFEPIKPLLTRWHDRAQVQGLTVNQAALLFIRGIPYVDKVIIGVDSLAQFNSCVEDFSIEEGFDAIGLACDNPIFLNPSLWELE
jgi:aryl-alcohol dehydrogenase-like predicted oxidoreductase